MNPIINKAKDFIVDINKKYNIKFAYIFGSQATDTATENSDIDIAIYFDKNYTPTEDVFIRGDIIEDGKAFFKKDVDVVSLNNTSSLLLKYEIIHDGIVIKDHDERAYFESLSLREYFDFKYYSDIYDNTMIEKIKNGEYFRR